MMRSYNFLTMAGLDPAIQLASVCERNNSLARADAHALDGRLKGGHGGEVM
jgi:hypothetical protein